MKTKQKIYEVNAGQKTAVEGGLKDYKKGRTYSQNEVDELMKAWLKDN